MTDRSFVPEAESDLALNFVNDACVRIAKDRVLVRYALEVNADGDQRFTAHLISLKQQAGDTWDFVNATFRVDRSGDRYNILSPQDPFLYKADARPTVSPQGRVENGASISTKAIRERVLQVASLWKNSLEMREDKYLWFLPRDFVGTFTFRDKPLVRAPADHSIFMLYHGLILGHLVRELAELNRIQSECDPMIRIRRPYRLFVRRFTEFLSMHEKKGLQLYANAFGFE